MIGPFAFLMLRTFRNRLLARLRRLKRPRYLLFATLGAAYFYFFAVRHWVTGLREGRADAFGSLPPGTMELVAGLAVTMSLVLAACGPAPGSPLAFTEAEVHFLFPAPIDRRRLVRFKLMRGQVGAFVSMLFFTLVSGRVFLASHLWIFLAGAWVVFSTLQLVMTGIRVARHRLDGAGVGWAARVAVVAALTLGIAVAGWYWAGAGIAAPPHDVASGSDEFQHTVARFARLFDAGPLLLATMPARLLVRPALADGAASFLVALGPALGLLALSYLGVTRAGVPVEEGALETAVRASERRARRRSGQRSLKAGRPLFDLGPTGRPETALLWKNLIAARRGLGGRGLFRLVLVSGILVVAFAASARGRGSVAPVAGALCGLLAVMLGIAGPGAFRIDFSQELLRLDVLKAYPLRGRAIVLGTILAPVAILTAMEWMLLAALLILSAPAGRQGGILPIAPAAIALAGALLIPCITLITSLLHNATLLMMPAWVTLGPSRTSGVEMFGQGIVTTAGRFLSLCFIVLPAAAVFLLCWWLAALVVDASVALPLAAVPAAVVMIAEAWAGIYLLGGYLEKFDPSSELDSSGQNP